MPSDAKVIDARNKLVMPGGIDTSTNLLAAEEGLENGPADDFSSGTLAALAGGTTMIVDMVVPAKSETLKDALESAKEAAAAKASCDYAFKVMLT